MKQVLDAQHHAEAHFVKGLLESHGIAAEVRGESLFTTVEAASAIPGMRPSVWIQEEAQLEAAKQVVAAYQSSEGQTAAEAWVCPACGERHEGQFNSCWKCGASAP